MNQQANFITAQNPAAEGQVGVDLAADLVGGAADLSDRQREVLTVVLDLMVQEGDGFSLAKVAKQASCSKETLYNWFGDRDGLLTATVQWQASKVRMPGLVEEGLTANSFRDGLIAFAVSWLEVITSDVSAALNRLAISHAGSGKSRLGDIVLQNGPLAMTRKLRSIFQIGERAGLVIVPNMDIALRSFFGLVVADWQIRKLLGEETRPSGKGIEMTARRAVEEFLVLYGAKKLKEN